MVNLGVTTTAVFLMIGMLQDRTGTTLIADFGGVASRMPILTGFWILAAMASIGLPLTNGFVGEFLIFNGTFTSGFAWGRMAACLATLGVLLAAAYMLWMTKRSSGARRTRTRMAARPSSPAIFPSGRSPCWCPWRPSSSGSASIRAPSSPPASGPWRSCCRTRRRPRPGGLRRRPRKLPRP